MARLPSIIVPEQALPIIQRGNNRHACFFAHADNLYYIDSLISAATRFGGHVHA